MRIGKEEGGQEERRRGSGRGRKKKINVLF
jgi:hypothetical protein